VDIIVIVEVLEENRELVPAEACSGIGGAQATLEYARDGHQRLIACSVAQTVVQRLEVVNINERHGKFLCTLSALERMFHAFREEHSVGKMGEIVMEGLMTQLLLQLGDITK
jgi:hypothetical protein